MKIPSKLKIGPYTYKIEYPYRFTERTDIDGSIDHSQLKIFISDCNSTGLPLEDERVLGILIHEVLHGINYNASGLIFSKDPGTEENQIEVLAHAILAFLIDNKLMNGRRKKNERK